MNVGPIRKSTISAAICLACLLADGEGGCEAYLAASSKDQSGLIYDMAAGMIEQNDDLATLCKIVRYHKRIEVGSSYLRSIPADDATAHGFNVHCAVGDEIHAWKRRDLFDVLRTGRASRDQPLCVWITTAAASREGLCYQLYDQACRIRDRVLEGKAARTFLPVVYEAPRDADWQDVETWRQANPCFGTAVSEKYLAEACDEARDNVSLQNTFRRLHLNQFTSQVERWIDMERWLACDGTSRNFEPDETVYAGLDFSVSTDFTAWCLWQPATGIVTWRYFLPAERIEQLEEEDMMPYAEWAELGWLTLSPGETIDYEFVEDIFVADCEEHEVHAVGIDIAYAAHVAQRLRQEGYEVVKVPQTFATLNSPCVELERLIVDKSICHGSNPITRWMFDNVEIERDSAGRIRPRKPKRRQNTRKIDGVAAFLNALQMSIAHEDPDISDQFSNVDDLIV